MKYELNIFMTNGQAVTADFGDATNYQNSLPQAQGWAHSVLSGSFRSFNATDGCIYPTSKIEKIEIVAIIEESDE